MIHTFTGKKVDVGNLRAEDIDPYDIAHALACINRYQGHAPIPYSVAQHSVLACRLAPKGHELAALLHDAHEAYVGDVPRPMKSVLPDYRALEERVAAIVRRRFRVPEILSDEVDLVDTRLLATEAWAFSMPWWIDLGVAPFMASEFGEEGWPFWEPWPWDKAKNEFIMQFEEWGGFDYELFD